MRQLAALLETFSQNNGQPIVAILGLTNGGKISSIYRNSVTIQSIFVKLCVLAQMVNQEEFVIQLLLHLLILLL
jgi:hypothetical protein